MQARHHASSRCNDPLAAHPGLSGVWPELLRHPAFPVWHGAGQDVLFLKTAFAVSGEVSQDSTRHKNIQKLKT